MRKHPFNLPLILFTKLVGWPGALLLFKPRLYYEDKAVQGRRLGKGTVLMSNHRNLLDFVLYETVFFDRNIRFLMAEVLFGKGKLMSWLLYGFGGIYVNRDAMDFSFVTESVDWLRRGGIVGIFPEGRLPVPGEHHPYAPSTALIALRAGAKIIPVVTDGVYGPLRRTSVLIGKPISLHELTDQPNPTGAELERLSALLEAHNNGLLELLAAKKEGRA